MRNIKYEIEDILVIFRDNINCNIMGNIHSYIRYDIVYDIRNEMSIILRRQMQASIRNTLYNSTKKAIKHEKH